MSRNLADQEGVSRQWQQYWCPWANVCRDLALGLFSFSLSLNRWDSSTDKVGLKFKRWKFISEKLRAPQSLSSSPWISFPGGNYYFWFSLWLSKDFLEVTTTHTYAVTLPTFVLRRWYSTVNIIMHTILHLDFKKNTLFFPFFVLLALLWF